GRPKAGALEHPSCDSGRPADTLLSPAPVAGRGVQPSPMDPDRVADVMTYALCVAAENDDWRERELGPIHLIKYVYLADLAHAEARGEGFTGAAWQFYHFGPWSPAVADCIDPTVSSLGASMRTFEGVEGRGTRFHVPDVAGLRAV